MLFCEEIPFRLDVRKLEDLKSWFVAGLVLPADIIGVSVSRRMTKRVFGKFRLASDVENYNLQRRI